MKCTPNYLWCSLADLSELHPPDLSERPPPDLQLHTEKKLTRITIRHGPQVALDRTYERTTSAYIRSSSNCTYLACVLLSIRSSAGSLKPPHILAWREQYWRQLATGLIKPSPNASGRLAKTNGAKHPPPAIPTPRTTSAIEPKKLSSKANSRGKQPG